MSSTRRLITTGVVSLGLVALPLAAQAPPPVPLKQYLKDNSPNSKGALQFVSMRCATLYVIIAATLKNDPNPTMSNLSVVFGNNAQKLLGVVLSTGVQEDYVTDQMRRMSDMYSERMRAARANTGDIFSDALLSSDVDLCKEWTERLK